MFFETLKANLLIILFLVVIALLGYWAVITLQVNPDEFETRVADVGPVIENDPTGYQSQPTQSPVVSNTQTETPSTSSSSQTSTSNSSHQDLIDELQELIDDNVLMKKGSRGTRVGTVQKFLNIYNGTDSKVDNDFGGTTENQIKAFQKSEGISADGQAGPGTYKKMIEWLNKQ